MKPQSLLLVLSLIAVLHAIRVPVWHQAEYAVQRHQRQFPAKDLQEHAPPKLAVDSVLKTKSRPVFFTNERSHLLKKVVPNNSPNKPYIRYHENNNRGISHYKAHFRPTPIQHNGNNTKESKKGRAVDFTYRTNHVDSLKNAKYFDKPKFFETFKEQDALSTGYQEPLFKPQSYASFPISDHNIPFEVPSSPYYYKLEDEWSSPSEGQTERSNTINLAPLKQHHNKEDNVQPEGYAVFEDLQNDFIEERKKFSNDLNSFPRNHKINLPVRQEEHLNERFHFITPTSSNSDRNEEIEKPELSIKQVPGIQEEGGSSEESTEFVPFRLYSQVREIEDSEHLPSTSAVEPNLKEIVKDSKIHTVYTEEGYEDSVYDHGAHVKNAESEAVYNRFSKESDHPKPVKDIDSGVNENDSDLAGSSYGVPVVVGAKHNKYAKTIEVKVASLKDIGNGNMELEIKSHVKMLDTPNNGKELHKYINIYPKNYAQPLINSTTENDTTALPIFSSVNYTKTTNIKANSVTSENILNDISKHLIRSKRGIDLKNLTEDLPKINENEFDLPKETPTTTTENILKKYPYYKTNDRDININSPLRYAEDLSMVPVKREGRMTFYEQADLRKECSEVEGQVDPIPNRIKDKEQDIGEEQNISENIKDENKEPKLPRLGRLGDKIDCFKRKYFGDNPLDSPIFKEETVGQPIPIFKEFDTTNHDEKYKKIIAIEIETKLINEQGLRISENVKTTTPYSFSLLTTPNYGTDHKPKNIYDQIDLINTYAANIKTEDAPETGNLEDRIEKSIGIPNFRMPKVSDIIFDNQNATESRFNETVVPAPFDDDYYDDLEAYNATDTNSTSESLPESLPLIILRRRRKRPSHLRRTVINKQDTAFSRKRLIKKPNKYPHMSVSQFNQIFPTTTFSPKYNVISEVHYKNEIKPNEQLNVFADIINNIKNASMFDDLQSEATKVEPINVKLHTNADENTSRKIKIPNRKIKIRNPEIDQSLSESQNVGQNIKNNYFYNPPSYPTVSTNIQSFYPRKKSKITKEHKSSEQLYEEFMTALKNKDYSEQDQQIDSFFRVKPITFNDYTNRKRRRKPTLTNFYQNNYPTLNEGEQQDEPQPAESEVQKSTEIDSVPDQEIYKKKRPLTRYITIDEKPMNIYFVPGMRPPPLIEKPFLYSDYRLTYPINTIRRRMGYGNHRVRRSPSEYSDTKRTNLNRRPSTVESSEENDDEDDDDYVPHRPTSYHYDPETKKIIYDKPMNKESSEEEDDDDSQEEEEEEEEEEAIEQKQRKITVETTPKSSKVNTIYHKDALDMKNGPTLIDFVNLVKSNPKYVEIKDPEPTEESISNTTSLLFPTGNTTPAIFLDILSKVRNNPDYKQINDADDDKKNEKTTTEVSLIENEEREAAADEVKEEKNHKRFQNAPGGQFGPGYLQVFDISEYLPKIKTYNPQTSIDYSKYKTIERSTTVPTTKHHMSSKYSEDDEEAEQQPKKDPSAMGSIVKDELRKGGSEALQLKATTSEPLIIITPENSTPRFTTTTTTTTSKPRINIRQRKRPTTTQGTTTERTKEEFTTQHEEIKYTRATHRPASRVYPRRPIQKIRIRTRTTTESSEEEESIPIHSKRVINRRDNTNLKILQEVPSNHKPVYTPITKEGTTAKSRTSVRSLAGQFKFATPRLVTEDNNRTIYTDPNPGKPEPRIIIEREESRQRFVLRRPRVQNIENIESIEDKNKRFIKVEPKFIIIEEDDNTATKSLNEIPTSAKLVMNEIPNVTTYRNEIISKVDKNIDSELLDVIGVAVKRIISVEKEEEHKGQKNHPQIESRSFDLSNQKPDLIPNNSEVLTKGYIHARNIDVEVFKAYDPTMKHGGNYKYIHDVGLSNIVGKYIAPTAYEIEDTPEIKRLSDIVPKPFAFYSDPKLPTTVNQLNIQEHVIEEIPVQELTANVAEFNSNDYDYHDAVKIFFRSGKQLEITTQKIEVKGIIKDPSKRLYFYAPVD